MASSSIFTVAILFSFLLASVLAARTQKLDPIRAACNKARNHTYCLKTLKAYPPAAAAKDSTSLARAVISIGKSYAQETLAFINETVAKEPTVKKSFSDCYVYYHHIVLSFESADGELKEAPELSNYDVLVATDDTRMVVEKLGEAKKGPAKTLMDRTRQMNAYIDLAIAATDVVWDEHKHP